MSNNKNIILKTCENCNIEQIEIEINTRGAMNKKYCDTCIPITKSENTKRIRRGYKIKEIYPKLLVNLTKNYIILVEGIKK